jgi:anaerobic magnesium-protoporphyrin IX monomethyl ester cyclase
MRTAFIIKDVEIAEPLGIMYVASVLKTHGHDVKLFATSRKKWLSQLRDYQPKVVAYSVISGSHNEYLRINNLIKNNLNAFSVFGGPHTTFFPETINHENVDAICIGEGEQAMLDLVTGLESGSDISKIENLWVKDNGFVHRNPVRALNENLDKLPFPDRELIYGLDRYLRENKVKRFISNRGCPFNCTYCFNRAYKEIYKGNKIIRWRSVENLIDEIDEVKRKYPLGLVRFIDDIFILPPVGWLEDFRDLYRRKIRLPFVCNLQVKTVTEEKVRLIKEAGCSAVYMAIEAGNDLMRNKLLERRMTKQDIIKSFDLVHKYGIPVGAENILGLPGGSLETDMETVELNIKCKVDNPISTIFQPYPKTKLGEYALERGYFNGDFSLLDESYFRTSQLKFISRSEKRKIENLHKFFGLAVNFPSFLPLIKILIKLPPNRIFGLIHRIWDSYCKRKKIFRVEFSLRDYVLAIVRVLRY